jgi:hypothetical protein
MIAHANQFRTKPEWHTGFLKTLPAIVRTARQQLRNLAAEACEEAIAYLSQRQSDRADCLGCRRVVDLVDGRAVRVIGGCARAGSSSAAIICAAGGLPVQHCRRHGRWGRR